MNNYFDKVICKLLGCLTIDETWIDISETNQFCLEIFIKEFNLKVFTIDKTKSKTRENTFRKCLQYVQGMTFFIYGKDLNPNGFPLRSKWLSIEGITQSSFNICRLKHIDKNSKFRKNNTVGLPYRLLSNNKEVYLPYFAIQSISYTGGLGAGKTKEETILRGIMDCIEKYAIKRIYCMSTNYFTPLLKEVYMDIPPVEYLNKRGYKIRVLYHMQWDTFPVVVVIISFRDNAVFSIVCDKNIRSAIYRGVNNIIGKTIQIQSNLFKLNAIKSKDRKGFILFHIKNNFGPVNPVILENNHPIKKTGSISKSTVNYTIATKKLDALKIPVYSSDLSFLNLHTYHVYIPKISLINMSPSKDFYLYVQYFQLARKLLINYDNSSQRDRVQLIEILILGINTYGDMLFELIFQLESSIVKQLLPIDPEMVLAVIFVHVKEYKKAYTTLQRYLKNSLSTQEFYFPKDQNIIYFSILEIIKLLKNGKTLKEAASTVSMDTSLIESFNELYDLFFKTNKLEKYFKPLTCSQCQPCEFKLSCTNYSALTWIKAVSNNKN